MAAVTAAKERILKKIRKALSNPVPLPFPQSEGTEDVFMPSPEDDAVLFAEEFTKLGGKFVFCADEAQMQQQLLALLASQNWQKVYCVEEKLRKQLQLSFTDDLPNCDVSITGCEYLVARTGSIVMSSAQQSGRTTSVYAPVHICIAHNSQLLFDVKDALSFLKAKYENNFPSFVTLATGPSRTADIEKTLVTGVHGPKEVYCFLIEH